MSTPPAGVDLRRAFVYLAPYWRRLVLVMIISLVSTAVSLATPYLTRDLVDRALVGRDLVALRRIVGLFAVLGVLSYVLNVVSGLRYTRVSAEILFDMRLDLYRHLQRLSPRFYARTRLGDIVARINGDIGEIQRVAAEAALAWVGNILFLIGCVVMLVWLDWRLALVTAAIMPASLGALVFYRRRLEARVATLRQRSADVGSFLIETLQAQTLIVTANAQEHEVSRFRRLNTRFIDALMGMQRLSYLSGGLPGVLLALGASLVFLYGGSRVVDGTLTLGTFAAFIAYQMRVMAPVQALMGLYTALATAKVSWGRVLELLDAPVDVREAADARALPDVRGTIAFDHVSLSTERGQLVLDDVSVEIEAGTSVAIVGASGSGKSTIASLVLRLIDPDRGVVRLDGHDLRTVRLPDLRRHVVLVEQEPTLLHASVGENIRYGLIEDGPGAPPDVDAAVRRAAEAAGISAFIERLPQKYDTVVGERGLQVSAGERQRLALARAFLANPSVLVLDEPTAALDPVAERAVVDGYRAVMRGRTCLIISHRRDVAMSADRVVVLDGARVVQSGRPADLLAGPGTFATLFGSDATSVRLSAPGAARAASPSAV
ncbi:MAG: ABC transporter ATP-binding protein [Acidobacteria bacterium]|nr:ABC transporter ATP-binding protein [Acidobacteriota bacterium]